MTYNSVAASQALTNQWLRSTQQFSQTQRRNIDTLEQQAQYHQRMAYIFGTQGKYAVARPSSTPSATIVKPKPYYSPELFLEAIKAGDISTVRKALASSWGHIESRYTGGRTPLHITAELGHEALTSLLIESHADAEARSDEGTTPLWHAAKSNKLGTVRVLLAAGANPDNPNRYGETPLFMSAGKADFIVFTSLAAKSKNLNAVKDNGSTAFMVAVEGPDAEQKMDFLYKAGVDIHKTSDNGQTAFHKAARYGIALWVEFYVKNKTPVDLRDSLGCTPLLLASQGGHLKIMQLLQESGGDPKTTDKRGWSILHFAAQGTRACLEFAFSIRSDINTGDFKGNVPLHHAAYNGTIKCMEFLLERGALVDRKSTENATSLHHAVQQNQTFAVNLLLSSSADPNARTGSNLTPLHLTASTKKKKENPANNVQIARSLIQHGADVNALGSSTIKISSKSDSTVSKQRTVKNLTPLHLAAINRDEPLIELLVLNNGDERMKDSSGQTPYAYASKAHLENATRLLQQAAKNRPFNPFSSCTIC